MTSWGPGASAHGPANPDYVALVEAHGFELVGMSDINANPLDSADHEGGVWQMPPSWGGKKPELENIGESDRMTLLFRKR